MARRYVIIGSGVAGLSAAESIRHNDPLGDLTIVSDDPDGYYSRPGLAYWLNRVIPERQLFPRPTAELRALVANWIHAQVTQILLEEHAIALADGRQLGYDRLLLATGSRATPLKFPGNDLQGLVNLYTLEDVRRILKLVKRGRTAVVIGDGIIGIELAEGLAALGVRVHVFLLGDRYWPMVLDETESRLMERGLEMLGIRSHYQTQLAQALGRQGLLTAIETKSGDILPCQLLGVAIGVLSRMELAQQAGLPTERGILVDEYLATSAEDVFAAGNVAQVRDPRTGRAWLETLWPTARKQGQIAGINLAGGHTPYTREVPFNAVKIGGIITTTIGAIEQGVLTVASNDRHDWQGGRRDWGVVVHEDRTSRLRVFVGERTILGAVVMGDQSPAQPLLHMIREEIDISPIRMVLEEHPEQGVDVIARLFREVQSTHVRA